MEPLSVAEKLKEKFPDAVSTSEEFRGQVSVVVDKSALLDVCTFLHDEPALSFHYVRDITAADYLGVRETRFDVIYHLLSIEHGVMIRLHVPVTEKDCTIDSVTSIWIGADWHERECFDMFGIRFNGHPDLRRILMPEDWKGFPLRKDYPVRGPEDPEDEWPEYRQLLEKSQRLKEYDWPR